MLMISHMLLLHYLLLAALPISFAFGESCQSTKGAYGHLEGTVQHVPVAYQLELQLGTAIETVLEAVETALVDQLLPYIFRECTDDELITDILSGIRSAAIRPVNGVACSITTKPSSSSSSSSSTRDSICFVVRGQLDLYYLADSHAMESIIRQAIVMDVQAILDHHSVDHSTSEEVIAVSFVDVHALPNDDPVSVRDRSSLSSSSLSPFEQKSYISLFVVNIILMSFALVCHRRRILQDGSVYLPLSN